MNNREIFFLHASNVHIKGFRTKKTRTVLHCYRENCHLLLTYVYMCITYMYVCILVEVPSLDVVGSSTFEEFSKQHHSRLPVWEKKLVIAQNVLFNQELFTTVSFLLTGKSCAMSNVKHFVGDVLVQMKFVVTASLQMREREGRRDRNM